MLTSPDNPITPLLDSDEHLLWSGQPKRGLRLQAQDVFVIPFSLMWCGFAIFWESSVLQTKAPFFFKLWGIPFVLAGLYMVFGRFFVDAWMRGRTHYGVTSERVIIVSGLFTQQIKSLQLRTLSDVSLIERKGGCGTITLGPSIAMHAMAMSGSWPGGRQYSPPSLTLIEGAKEVYDIIRKAQKAAK